MIGLSPEDLTNPTICRFWRGGEAFIFDRLEAFFQTTRYIDE